MAKVSPVSIKYMIHASFKAQGPLEKPDVIGAIFGQTEGLLGEALEMRELQKEGKIGRIEVDLEVVDGKSVGEIQMPSALDKSETTIIAAALETIDRIGPTEAEIKVLKIEDVRGAKRDFIIQRAKELLGASEEKHDFGSISQTVKEDTRAEKIQEYGDERLPAGDLSGNEIIVVEGRADVVNLLKNRVNNVIGMNGTKLPLEIAKLGEKKEITLFVDGDRGGKLIAQNVINNARIKYVAVAPDGKEVEELTGKEILMALRKRVEIRDFLYRLRKGGDDFKDSEAETEEDVKVDVDSAKKKIKSHFESIKGTKQALLLDPSMSVILKVSARDAGRSINMLRQKIFAVIVDGTATSGIISACEERGVMFLAATTFSDVGNTKINLINL